MASLKDLTKDKKKLAVGVGILIFFVLILVSVVHKHKERLASMRMARIDAMRHFQSMAPHSPGTIAQNPVGGVSRPAPPVAVNDVPQSVKTTLVGLLEKLTHNKANVQAVYRGPGGLVGLYWLTDKGVKRIAWGSPDGTLIIPSAVYNSDGVDVTGAANRKINGLPPLPTAKPTSLHIGSNGVVDQEGSAYLMSVVPKLPSFKTGRGAKSLYVFADPDCIVCHEFWEKFGKNQHDVTIHWILVGFLHQKSSAYKAASILASRNPEKAFVYDEAHYDKTLENGGFPVNDNVSQKKLAIIDNDAKVMAKGLGGILATPVFVWMGTDGQPHAVGGPVKNWQALVNSIQ